MITHVEPVNGFVGNRTFRLHTVDEVYYLKESETAAEEARACRLVSTLDVPAPTVVASGSRYLITRTLRGEPAREDQRRVLREAGECVRRVHSIVGDSSSWGTYLRSSLEDLSVLPASLRARVLDVMPPFIDSVSKQTPVLLHGDLHLRHVYADRGQLTGILDWGDTTYGDPAFDLARFSMAGPRAMAAFLDGYGAVDVPESTLSCYRVLWSVMALQAEHRAGGDWFQPHLDRIAAEVS